MNDNGCGSLILGLKKHQKNKKKKHAVHLIRCDLNDYWTDSERHCHTSIPFTSTDIAAVDF